MLAGQVRAENLDGTAPWTTSSARETLVPNTTGSLPSRTSFTSMPVSSYAPVNQRPHIVFQSRSTNMHFAPRLSLPGARASAAPLVAGIDERLARAR